MTLEWTLHQWNIPLPRGLHLGGKRWDSRSGYYVRLSYISQNIAYEGWGEVAPLPGFSSESFDDIEPAFTTLRSELSSLTPLPQVEFVNEMRGSGLSLLESLPQLSTTIPASLRFGVECALLSAAGFFIPSASIQTAILLKSSDPQVLINTVNAHRAKGALTFKLKVGGGDLEEEACLVENVAREVGQENLRLDCNRAWNVFKARRFFKELKAKNIRVACVEEPTESPIYFNRLSSYQHLALDETLTKLEPLQLARAQSGTLVVKPTIVGGIKRALEFKEHAPEWPLIISSSLETPLGISHLAHIHKVIGNGPGGSASSSIAAGLDTVSFYTDPPCDGITLSGGLITLDQPVMPQLDRLSQVIT